MSRMREGSLAAVAAAKARAAYGLVRWSRPALKAEAVRFYWPHIRRKPVEALKFVLLDPEITNYTYDIGNLDELAGFIGTALGRDAGEMGSYVDELRRDSELRQELVGLLRKRRDRKSEPLFGRRIGWYCFVRALKPRLVVETGVHDGLGSVALLRALERNRIAGHPGRLVGIDTEPSSGWLVPSRLRQYFELVISDSVPILKDWPATEPIDLFLHDSSHTYEHEWNEYEAIKNHLAPSAVVLSDNAHAGQALMDYSTSAGRTYVFWHEQPTGHFYPGGGIGVSLPPRG
jgi:hypothetical protein